MILTLVLIGCVAGPGGESPATEPDLEWFISDVQPVLSASCANATCHGDPARPLEIYAVHNHRLDPEEVYLDGALSEQELWLNYRRASAFVDELTWQDEALADDCSLLSKPLDPASGGAEHTGGVQFFDTAEEPYEALRGWIADALKEAS